jgi:hypothetical protein
MSKEKARRRAEERARRSAPHPKADHSGASAEGKNTGVRKKRAPERSARAERQRRRFIVIAVLWALANAAIWLLTDTWNAKWMGLTLTTIAVPLIVWLVWDPEGRTNL